MTFRRMKATALVAAALTGAVIGVPQVAGAAPEDAPENEPARPYIVLVKRGNSGEHVANEHARARRAKVSHKYGTVLNGYAATIPDSEVDDVRRDPRVELVHPDQEFSLTAQQLPWGIDRIGADQSSQLAGNGSGAVSNVDVYVLDTGVDVLHPDLNVVNHQNFVDDNKNYDCNGHGTHVTGTAAALDNTSHVVGVAPGAPVTGVKVMNCRGSGPTSRVVAGMEWLTNDWLARRTPDRAAIANASIGGPADVVLDRAIEASAAKGITWAISAGNKSADACKYSPARAGQGTNGIITVGATTKNDGIASFSNRGPCVDIWAPGVGILSTWKGGSTNTLRGTSMASPHVAGSAALYLSANPGATPTQVEESLKSTANPVPGKPIAIVDAAEY